MAEPVREITIVGGGTAGWLAAAMLNRYLNTNADAPVRVSLIESGKLPPIGVGEATVPPMRQVLHDVGVDEHEFFRRCNATIKLGVRFTNWDVDAGGRPVEYLNSLTEGPVVNGRNPGAPFMAFAPPTWNFPRTVLPTDHLIDLGRAPRRIGDQPYTAALGYAYHFEAGLFAEFMRDHATGQGVRHVIDDVEHVEMAADGNVAALHLTENGRWPVQLVIDCTGFKGLIINKAMGEPFQPYSDCMLNDRAIVGQIPRGAEDPIYPYTGAWALSSGWVWRIPLYSRISSGYVFSSAHLSDDAARAELLNHWGVDEETFQPRVVPMRVGKTRRTWVNNCVSIGLASGFIEPLESTGIYMTDRAIRVLIDYFPIRGFRGATTSSWGRCSTKSATSSWRTTTSPTATTRPTGARRGTKRTSRKPCWTTWRSGAAPCPRRWTCRRTASSPPGPTSTSSSARAFTPIPMPTWRRAGTSPAPTGTISAASWRAPRRSWPTRCRISALSSPACAAAMRPRTRRTRRGASARM